jgi:BASS family bile acid:Na+ symporter
MQELFKLAVLALKVSVLMQVVAIGLGTTWEDATYLFRRPALLVNSVLARNVAVPVIAILLIKAFSFHVAVAITLGVLAVTPVPPLLPKSQLKAGARSEYVLGLLVSQSLLAIVLVPVTVELMDLTLGAQAHFNAGRVAALVAQTILIPLAAGMLASKFLPKLHSFAPQLMMAGTLLLIAGAIPLMILGWKAFGTLAGNGAMLAMAIFVIAGTVAGHFLGGPRAEDRTTLAVATSSRHPGLALAIAYANFPEQARLVAGAIVIYLILRMVLLLPYLRWPRSSPERILTSPYGTRRPNP